MGGNELITIEDIQGRIYSLRGVQVMLDKDLALFYEVNPIRMREQVKRNINRFPSDFMFKLTEDEVDFMVSQVAIPSKYYPGDAQLFYELFVFREETNPYSAHFDPEKGPLRPENSDI